MLHVKIAQVIAIEAVTEKGYDFTDDKGEQRKGTSIYSTITALMANGKVTLIKIKGKTTAEVDTKLKAASLTIGKPADLPVTAATVVGGVLNCTA